MASSATTTRTSFSDLNQDVIGNVLFFLIPTDILSVRKTYKTGYRASKHRSVWHAALTTLIHEHQLFAPTYDDIDALPTAELERLASFPSRILQRFSTTTTTTTQRNAYLPPTTQRVLIIPLSDDELASQSLLPLTSPDLDTDVAHMTMIPGGRFLLTVSPTYPDGRTYMKLFDLGRPGCGSARVGLVAGFEADAMRVHATAPTPTGDGRGIRVVVQVFGNIIQVLEVYPLSSKPLFTLVRSFQMPANGVIQSIDISGERVVCSVATPPLPGPNPDGSARCMRGHIVVWDYGIDKWGVVYTGMSVHNKCVLRGDSIVSLLNNELFAWNVPALEPASTPSDPITIAHDTHPTPPRSTHFLSFWNTRPVVPNNNPMHVPRAGWHTDPAAPLYLWTSQWGSRAEIAVFRLTTTNNNNSDNNHAPDLDRDIDIDISAPHVRAEFHDLKPHPGHWGPLHGGQPCHRDNIVLQALGHGCVHFVRVGVGVGLPDSPVPVEATDIFALRMGKFVPENVQVCLATGRACALRLRYDVMDPPGEVRIYDYL